MQIFIKFEQVYQKLPALKHFKIIIRYKTQKNMQVPIFIKIGPVNQKLPEGG